MTIATVDTPALVSLNRLYAGTPPAGPWRCRLTFIGDNPNNASGESRKYWQFTGNGTASVEVRWGRIGARGQSMTLGWREAAARGRAKLAKGYTVDDDTFAREQARGFTSEPETFRQNYRRRMAERAATTPIAQPAGPASLAEALGVVSWIAVATSDTLIDAAASFGWVLLDLDGVTPDGFRLFIDRVGSVWAVHLASLAYGPVPVWSRT